MGDEKDSWKVKTLDEILQEKKRRKEQEEKAEIKRLKNSDDRDSKRDSLEEGELRDHRMEITIRNSPYRREDSMEDRGEEDDSLAIKPPQQMSRKEKAHHRKDEKRKEKRKHARVKEKEREHERRKRHREEQDKARREWERQKRRELAREHSRRERDRLEQLERKRERERKMREQQKEQQALEAVSGSRLWTRAPLPQGCHGYNLKSWTAGLVGFSTFSFYFILACKFVGLNHIFLVVGGKAVLFHMTWTCPVRGGWALVSPHTWPREGHAGRSLLGLGPELWRFL
uniref:Cell division cycle 2-like 1 (PITSLRE proteins) n=1 Tax=Bos taurus TaxID=9913 RepID=A1L586_BOVIN|nr:cell division cycle 2-like 1 (PITSLRE proteins) [Bos taurus]